MASHAVGFCGVQRDLAARRFPLLMRRELRCQAFRSGTSDIAPEACRRTRRQIRNAEPGRGPQSRSCVDCRAGRKRLPPPIPLSSADQNSRFFEHRHTAVGAFQAATSHRVDWRLSAAKPAQRLRGPAGWSCRQEACRSRLPRTPSGTM